MMNFRGWQLGHGLIMLPDIRDLRGVFSWLPRKQKGKVSFKKSKITSSSVTIQEYQPSERCQLSLQAETHREIGWEKSSKEEEN